MKRFDWAPVAILVTVVLALAGGLWYLAVFVGEAKASMNTFGTTLVTVAEEVKKQADTLSNHEGRIGKLEGKDEARSERRTGRRGD